jgi:hypothetical protein
VVGLCQRYATSPDSGAGPRVFLTLLMGGSVYLNITHAVISGYGTAAQVLYASPAVVACLLFELDQRFRNREQRRALGRVAPSLPVLGGWAFVMFPWRSVQVLRAHVRMRLDEVASQAVAPVHAAAEVIRTPIDGPTHDARELPAGEPSGTHARHGQPDPEAASQVIESSREDAAERAVRPTERPLSGRHGRGVLTDDGPEVQAEQLSHVPEGSPGEIAAEALARTGGDAKEARALLDRWGVNVHPSTVYRARNKLIDQSDDPQDSQDSQDVRPDQPAGRLPVLGGDSHGDLPEQRANVQLVAPPETDAEKTMTMAPIRWS